MEPEWHGDFKLVMGLASGGLTPVRNFTVAEKVWFHAIQYQKIQYHSTLRRWMSSEAVCVLLVKHKLLLTGIVSGLHCATHVGKPAYKDEDYTDLRKVGFTRKYKCIARKTSYEQ